MKRLLKEYEKKKSEIKARLRKFKNLSEEKYFDELIFCILTPQSNAKKCWEAVGEIKSQSRLNETIISNIIKRKTRFHNNKARYLISAIDNWDFIKSSLKNKDIVLLRNHLAESIKGYGLKEASHFIRNIGKSDNKIAILDRHILRNLKALKVIKNDRIKNKSDYLEKEQKFIEFSRQIGIPIDELDLLFWSKENGEIFK